MPLDVYLSDARLKLAGEPRRIVAARGWCSFGPSAVSGIASAALCTGLLCLVDRLIHSNTQQLDCDVCAAVVNYFMATKTVNLYIYW